MVCVIGLAIVVTLLSTMRRRTQHFSRFPLVPSLAGITDSGGRQRLALVSNAGRCQPPGCGGKLRFYAKATAWVDTFDANGRRHCRVTERTPVAECTHNPRDHAYKIDATDTSDLDRTTDVRIRGEK